MGFKRAQGLPLNTIIIAILVVVVLVVVILIFTGSIGQTTKVLKAKNPSGTACQTDLGGYCVPFKEACPTNAGYQFVTGQGCSVGCCYPYTPTGSGDVSPRPTDPHLSPN